MSELQSDLEIIDQILHHRLQRDDIQKILSKLNAHDQDVFTLKVAQVLKRTSALLEVSRRVTEDLDLDVMLPKMVRLVSEFVDAERATIFLHDSENSELFSRVAQGELKFEIRLLDTQGLVGACYQAGHSIIINDPYADARFDPETDRRSGFRTKSVLCAPIKHRQEVIGVVQVLNQRGEGFDATDKMSLEAIAQHTSVGFENARLYDQITRARVQEQRLFDVTTVISQELQLKPLLIKVMEAVTSFLDADRSTLFLCDEERGELWSQVAQGSTEIRFPSHLGIAGSVFTSGKTVNIIDAYQDDRFNPSFDRKTGYHTRTILCIPVLSKSGKPIGVIQVINKRDGVFNNQDERSLRAFAAQASIAIENAKLFEQVIEVKRYNEAVLESMSNGVLTLGSRGDLVTANRAATELLGGDAVIHALMRVSGTRIDRDAEVGEHRDAREVETFLSTCQRHLPQLAEVINKARTQREQVISLDHPLSLNALAKALLGAHAPEVEERSVNITAVPLTLNESSSTSDHTATGDAPGIIVVLEDMSQEKRLRGTMARYVPPEVADQLLREGGEMLGGNLQETTILFSDIRDFTTISEALGPQETVRMLNEYFGVMVDVISEHKGILDKFIGDAIMAVFGAPFPSIRDPDHAVDAAVEMLRALDQLNARRLSTGERAIEIGVGLNTGEVLSGNIGSEKRMDYTVIGDGVNLAARLEGLTKGFGAPLLISEFTAAGLAGEHPLREVDLLRVKGKLKPVRVYEVMTHKLERTPDLARSIVDYERGLALYRQSAWSEALVHFERAASYTTADPLSQVYAHRCRHFISAPPTPDWDGVWVMKSKS